MKILIAGKEGEEREGSLWAKPPLDSYFGCSLQTEF